MAYRSRSSAPRPARWMALYRTDHCHVCQAEIAAGDTAFWDPAKRTVTCHALPCCEADGLTTETWMGSPVSGGYATVRSERRARTVSTVTRFSSGAEVYTNRRGRCEDAPCCGCCT